MKTGITVPAQLGNVSTKVDGSLKLTFTTQELNGADAAVLLGMRNQLGWLLFSNETLQAEDVPDEAVEKEFDGDKSPSQRLRATLFVYWTQKKKQSGVTFNDFYRSKIETWIDQIKDHLE